MHSKWQRSGQVNKTTIKDCVISLKNSLNKNNVDHNVQQHSFIHSIVGQACYPQTKLEGFSFEVDCQSILNHNSIPICQTLGICCINE